jgi:predicted kinase
MCGFPGSGKSTEAKRICQTELALCVSRDAVRNMIGCGGYIFNSDTTEPIVKSIAHYGIMSLLKLGSVVVDETHITKKARREMIILAHEEYSIPIIVWCDATEGNVERRMAGDARGYTKEKWQEVIDGMKARFEPPTLDECEIVRVKI